MQRRHRVEKNANYNSSILEAEIFLVEDSFIPRPPDASTQVQDSLDWVIREQGSQKAELVKWKWYIRGLCPLSFTWRGGRLPFQENFTPFSTSSLGLYLDSISMFWGFF